MFKALSFVALTLLCFCSSAQIKEVKFERLNTNNGLSQSFIVSITQDKKGFMWFGTESGLNKFDGYEFTVYQNDPQDSSSIRTNEVWGLLTDSKGRLWAGTVSGLDLFNAEQNNFIHIRARPDVIRDIMEDSNGNIWTCSDDGLGLVDTKDLSMIVYQSIPGEKMILKSACEDKNGNIWLGSRDESTGVLIFDPKTKTFGSRSFGTDDQGKPLYDYVTDIFRDSQGVMWIASHRGLRQYNETSQTFTWYQPDTKNLNSVTGKNLHCLEEDGEGNLWVAHSRGISVFDKSRKSFSHHRYDIDNPTGLSENFVTSIYKDISGNVWVGTRNTGLNIYHRTGNNFKLYKHEVNNSNTLNNNVVKAIVKDKKGTLWLGTDGGGLNRLNDDGTFTAFTHNPDDPKSLPNDLILALYEDKQDNLWVSTFNGALSRMNKETGTFEHIFPGKDSTSLTSASVSVMREDSKGNFWVGTWYSGLYLFDRTTKNFKNFTHSQDDRSSLISNEVVAIYEDRNNNLWIGTTDGLDRFDYATQKFHHYQHDENNTTSLSSSVIHSISEDKHGNLLIGTLNGLNLFNTKNFTCTRYTTRDGLPSNTIQSAAADLEGNTWVSTLKGVGKFNPITKTCRNYGPADGLQGNEFIRHSYFVSDNGEIYFGGNNGANCIITQLIEPNNYVPPVVLTDLKIFNKSAEIGTSLPQLREHINHTRVIELSYKESVISFEFAALNFTNPNDNEYAYKLEGFDKEWNYAGNKRSATYTNLNAGTYVFKVIGSNNDGVWNRTGAFVTVVIKPPFWLTWWFRTLAILNIAGALFLIFKVRINRIKKQRELLEQQVKERTEQLAHSSEEERKARQEAEQANRAKSIFLATMSHEIRTPMNGVLGMASLLGETNLTEEQRDYTATIQNSGEALLGVINDILDFSKIESGKMELESRDYNLRDCIEEVFDVFAAKAAKSGVDLIYEIEHNVPSQIIGDNLRLRQVLINLVSNAIKFTHQGEIFLRVQTRHDFESDDLTLLFEVRDTGIGIPADKLERLFKAFSQVDSSTTRKYGGTGLGLAISEKLIHLMGGTIDVESTPGIGTNFMFTIKTQTSKKSIKSIVNLNVSVIEGSNVLVVDDNETNCTILKKQLAQWKLIPTVVNSAKEALRVLSQKQISFDLTLTDMQMPEMDGIELAQRIRDLYPQLPIVLLSSMGDERAKLHADLFNAILTKPVKQQTLYKHIVQQLRKQGKPLVEESVNQKKLSHDFSQQYPLSILIAEDNPVNQKLAERVLMKLGYKPDIAVNGLEAVASLKKTEYDIIFMDVQMPEMDGLEATRTIRSMSEPQPVIIAMTANAMQGDREMCLDAGMDDYISKPIKLENLVALIETWATRKRKSA
jgi:signal transduction histidine kinase/CheY-like chemotaxis protein/ligand-binding sensor domain-containing protein